MYVKWLWGRAGLFYEDTETGFDKLSQRRGHTPSLLKQGSRDHRSRLQKRGLAELAEGLP